MCLLPLPKILLVFYMKTETYDIAENEKMNLLILLVKSRHKMDISY